MGLTELANELGSMPFQLITGLPIDSWINYGATFLQATAIHNYLHPSSQSSRTSPETEVPVTASLTNALDSTSLNVVEPSSMIRLSESNSNFLEVGEDLQGYIQHSSRILIRQSYVELYNKFMTNGFRHTIVTGSSGIGKSLFLIYCAFHLIDSGYIVVLRMANNPFLYLINRSQVLLVDSGIENVRLGNLLKKSNPFIWLADGDPPLKWPYQKALLVTSPRDTRGNNFANIAVEYHMPLWTLEELLSLIKGAELSFMDEKELTGRFGVLNGVPRSIFNTANPAEATVRLAIDKSSDISQLLSKPVTSGSSFSVSHVLIVINTSDYISETADYASNYVFEQNELLQFVRNSLGIRSLGQMRGRWYEIIAHQVLRRGGTFRRRRLMSPDELKESGQSRTNSSETTIKMAAHLMNDFSKIDQAYEGLDGTLTDVNFEPKSKCFDSVNAWHSGYGMFQITINPDHDIKKAVHQIAAKSGLTDFYFVVPDNELFDSYKYKRPCPPDNASREVVFDQYVLWVPVPDNLQ